MTQTCTASKPKHRKRQPAAQFFFFFFLRRGSAASTSGQQANTIQQSHHCVPPIIRKLQFYDVKMTKLGLGLVGFPGIPNLVSTETPSHRTRKPNRQRSRQQGHGASKANRAEGKRAEQASPGIAPLARRSTRERTSKRLDPKSQSTTGSVHEGKGNTCE